MKKILLLIIVFGLALPCMATGISKEMLWQNIAPEQYQGEIHYIEDNTFANKHPVLAPLSCFTVVAIPFYYKSVNKSLTISVNNYWVKRKQNFNNSFSFCEQLENKNERYSCFINLVQHEQNKTLQQDSNLVQQQMLLQQQQTNVNLRNLYWK